MDSQKITPRLVDYSKWYLDIVAAADLIDNSPVRGCMVIKPYGFAIWEKLQQILNGLFKEKGVENAYFPLFIPKSFLEKEAEHIKGFAKECAIVTHHRLEVNEKGKIVLAGQLEEPLIVRPTSETIIYYSYAQWIKSYRDLPVIINQWANVVRWEMRTRPFIRTTEFLWQEGHTAHASKKEADEMALQMLEVYRKFIEEYLAIPVVSGKKSESEKFAGAVYTTSVEAMMQDGKALQMATSHMLGQNFAKVFDVKFLDTSGKEQFVWQTSWGLSTRVIGALIMVHGDDKGMVIPPKIAPLHIVIIPIWDKNEGKAKIVAKANEIATRLGEIPDISIRVDNRDERPGPKFFEWEKKGVPIRIEIGPRDVAKESVVVVRRDTGEKQSVASSHLLTYIKELLEQIQKNLFVKALEHRQSHSFNVDTWDEFQNTLETKGGFLIAHWCGNTDCEEQISEKTKTTIRCIPFSEKREKGKCIFCGNNSNMKVVFSKAY